MIVIIFQHCSLLLKIKRFDLKMEGKKNDVAITSGGSNPSSFRKI